MEDGNTVSKESLETQIGSEVELDPLEYKRTELADIPVICRLVDSQAKSIYPHKDLQSTYPFKKFTLRSSRTSVYKSIFRQFLIRKIRSSV